MSETKKKTALEKIHEFILENYGIDIKEDTREGHIAEYRSFYYLFAQKFTQYNEKEIASFVGRKRPTVVTMSNNLSGMLPLNPHIEIKYTDFERRCYKIIKGSRRIKRHQKDIVRDITYHQRMIDKFTKQLRTA